MVTNPVVPVRDRVDEYGDYSIKGRSIVTIIPLRHTSLADFEQAATARSTCVRHART